MATEKTTEKLKTFTFNQDVVLYIKGDKKKTEIAKGSTVDLELLPSLGSFGDLLGKPVTHEIDENGVLVPVSKKDKKPDDKPEAPKTPTAPSAPTAPQA